MEVATLCIYIPLRYEARRVKQKRPRLTEEDLEKIEIEVRHAAAEIRAASGGLSEASAAL